MNPKKFLLWVCMFQTFCLGFQAGGFQLALLKISGEYAVSGGAAGAIVATQFSAVVIFPLIFGWLSDRVGKKKVLMIFSSLCVVSCFTITAFSYLYAFFLGIFLLGAGLAMCESTTGAAIADAFSGKQEKYMNYVQACFCVGAAAGPPIADFMMNAGLNWRIVFTTTGAAYLLVFVLLMVTKFSEPAAPPEAKRNGVKRPPYGLLLRPAILLLIISVAMYVAVETGVAFFLDYLFTGLFNAPQASAAAISLFWFSMMISRIIAGVYAKGEKTATLIGFAFIAVLAVAITAANTVQTALVCCFLLGFAHGPVWPNLVGFASREYPADTGLTTGSMSAASGLGGAISPVFMGILAAKYNISASFTVFAFVPLIGLLTTFLYIKQKKRLKIN